MTAPLRRVDRAKIMPAFADGETVPVIARASVASRPKAGRCLGRARQAGPLSLPDGLSRAGRPRMIYDEARVWDVVCRRLKEIGCAEELRTLNLPTARGHGPLPGMPASRTSSAAARGRSWKTGS